MRFRDRKDAGKQLAAALQPYKGVKGAVVLAIPRGGVVTGRAVADGLGLPLDVVVTKKVTPPGNPEYAIGAVSGERVILDKEAMRDAGVTEGMLQPQIKELQAAVKRRYSLFRGKSSPPLMKGKTVIIVDDGIATGNTVRAAVALAKAAKAAKVVVAVPVGPPDNVAMLRREADEVVCLSEEPGFMAVGQFYDSFPQVEDDEAKALLEAKQ